MMNRAIRVAAGRVAALAAVAVLAGCGSSGEESVVDAGFPPQVDGGDPFRPDAEPNDAGVDGGEGVDVRDSGLADAAAVDMAPPQLVSSVPAMGAAFDVRAPLQLTFDEPLNASTVDRVAVNIEIGGESFDRQVVLSGDGRTIQVGLVDLPALPTTVEVVVADTVEDLAGNRFAGATLTFDAPVWLPVEAASTTNDRAVAAFRGAELWVVRRSQGNVVAHRWSSGLSEASTTETLNRQAGAAVGGPWIATAGNTVLLAWTERRGVELTLETQLYRQGMAPQALTAVPLASSAAEAVAVALLGTDATVVKPVGQSSEVERLQWINGEWATATVPVQGDSPTDGPALISAAGRVWWAAAYGSRIRLWRDDGAGGWVAINQIAAASPSDVQLSIDGQGAPTVGWITTVDAFEGPQSSLHVASMAAGTSAVASPAADLRLSDVIEAYTLRIDEQGEPFVAWTESGVGRTLTYAAAYDGVQWRHRRGVFEDGDRGLAQPLLATDGFGRMFVAGWDSVGTMFGYLANDWVRGDEPALPNGGVAGCAPLPADGAGFPQTLAATGCFTDAGLTPRAGVIPYSTTSQLWSDGAVKRRWFALPANETVQFNGTPDSAWSFPVGTVLIKEFGLQAVGQGRVVETRLYAKRCDSGCPEPWQGYSYRWAVDGSGATLRPAAEATTVTWDVAGTRFDHIYPSRSQCRECHTVEAGFVLGLSTVQLNRRWDYGAKVGNQLRALIGSGVAVGAPSNFDPATVARLHRHSDVYDGSREQRARSYLHANCSSCHRFGLFTPQMNFLAPAVAGGNICSRVTPGSAETSNLWRRMASRTSANGINPMPPLATGISDPDGLRAVGDWIDGLSTCP